MTYYVRKENLRNWDLQQINEEPMFNMENDDDQDIYISERSSIVSSSNDLDEIPSPITKRLPTPTPSPPLSLAQKQHHNVRRYSIELPENGVIPSIQLQHQNNKRKVQHVRKGLSNQKNVISYLETKPSELIENYYPAWHNPKVKNPDRISRHRQPIDGQIIQHESNDFTHNSHQPVLTTLSIKPKQQPRKSRNNVVSIIQTNHDKQRHESIEKNSSLTTNVLPSHCIYDNNYHQRRSSPKQQITLKTVDNVEHYEQSNRRTVSQQRGKIKPENEWNSHYTQSFTSKSPQDSYSLIITPNHLISRLKNRSKISDKNSSTSDSDEYNQHRQQYHHHNHNYNNHFHVRRRPPSGSQVCAEYHVVDVAFKKPDRSSYIQQTRDSFHSPASLTFNQNSHLPPITRDNHHKTNTTRFPKEYYGTLARQNYGKDWEESVDVQKIYKHDQQTRVYDHYLNTVVDKRLAA